MRAKRWWWRHKMKTSQDKEKRQGNWRWNGRTSRGKRRRRQTTWCSSKASCQQKKWDRKRNNNVIQNLHLMLRKYPKEVKCPNSWSVTHLYHPESVTLAEIMVKEPSSSVLRGGGSISEILMGEEDVSLIHVGWLQGLASEHSSCLNRKRHVWVESECVCHETRDGYVCVRDEKEEHS